MAGLSRELVRQDHEVDLVTMNFKDLAREENVDGVRLHRVPCLRRSMAVSYSHELLSYVAAAVKKLTGLPFVVTAHGSDVPGYNPDRFILHHRLLAPLWRIVTKSAAAIVCPSASLERLVHARDATLPTHSIPNGFRPSRFDATRPKELRVLAVTRMFERKGVQHLLEALRDNPLAAATHIAGDGPYLPALREQAARDALPVTFHGWLDNGSPALRELYETSRIFVFPSEAENFPIVLLEAMAAGAAVITTSGTGCAEVVGETGILVPPRDSAAIRDALVRLARDPALCASLGEAARRRVNERFTWEIVAEQYVRLYVEAGRRSREQVPRAAGVQQTTPA